MSEERTTVWRMNPVTEWVIEDPTTKRAVIGFVDNSDIEAVVRRMLGEQGWCKVTVSSGTVTHDGITHPIGPLERTPLEVNGPEVTATDDECERCTIGSYDDGLHAGKLLMAAEMEKVVKRELGDESEPPDRTRDIPEGRTGSWPDFDRGYLRGYAQAQSDAEGALKGMVDGMKLCTGEEYARLKRVDAAARDAFGRICGITAEASVVAAINVLGETLEGR